MKTPADPHPQEDPSEGKGKKKRPSKARRHHGEGTVFQRKDGRWQANISMGVGEDGKRKRLTRYGHTKAEALQKLQLAQQEIGQGTLLKSSQETLGQFLEYWLEQVHKVTIEITTYNLYRINLDTHILPGLGYIPLQKLTTAHIQAFYAKKMQERLSPGVIHLLHGILSAAIKDALKWERIYKDPCRNVKLPRKKKHEVQTLTKEQALRLIEAARSHHLEALIALALSTGMRVGELLGLYWHNIDFEHKSVQIVQAIAMVKIDGKYRIIEKAPKTASSKRSIMLPQFVVDMLQAHWVYQQDHKQQMGSAWQEHNRVFTTITGTYLSSVRLRQRFKKMLKAAGLPDMRFHDLRHNAATFLISLGINPKVVQEILGHATIQMTLEIYSHVLPSMQRQAMDDIDKFFRQ